MPSHKSQNKKSYQIVVHFSVDYNGDNPLNYLFFPHHLRLFDYLFFSRYLD